MRVHVTPIRPKGCKGSAGHRALPGLHHNVERSSAVPCSSLFIDILYSSLFSSIFHILPRIFIDELPRLQDIYFSSPRSDSTTRGAQRREGGIISVHDLGRGALSTYRKLHFEGLRHRSSVVGRIPIPQFSIGNSIFISRRCLLTPRLPLLTSTFC